MATRSWAQPFLYRFVTATQNTHYLAWPSVALFEGHIFHHSHGAVTTSSIHNCTMAINIFGIYAVPTAFDKFAILVGHFYVWYELLPLLVPKSMVGP